MSALGKRLQSIRQRIGRRYFHQVLVCVLCFFVPFALVPLARSQGAEACWERLETWPGDQLVTHVAVGERGHYLYAVGEVSGVYVSSDGGQRWQRGQLGTLRKPVGAVRILDLAVNPDDPREAYILIASPRRRPRPMVYRTEDGGVYWRALGALGPKYVQAIAFGACGDALYFVTTGDLYRGYGEGGGYIRRPEDLDRAHVASLKAPVEVIDLAVADWSAEGVAHRGRRAKTIYLGTVGRGLQVFVDDPVEGVHGLPYGEDTVSLWVRTGATVHTVCLHPQYPGLVCVGTDAGIYASVDGGRDWFPTAYPLRTRTILSLLIDPVSGAIYAGLAGGGVFCSFDNGATWQPLGRGLGTGVSVLSLALVEVGERALYAGTNDGLWRLPLEGVGP